MANGIMEIPLLENTLIPYCGFGIGEKWDKARLTIKPIITSEGTVIFDEAKEDTQGFAYQFIVGATFMVGQKLQGALEYRYLDGYDNHGNHTIDYH